MGSPYFYSYVSTLFCEKTSLSKATSFLNRDHILKLIWHHSHVVPIFALGLGCAKIGWCRDYILHNFFGNIILNYSTENILYKTCLIHYKDYALRSEYRIYNAGPNFYYLQHSIIIVHKTHLYKL